MPSLEIKIVPFSIVFLRSSQLHELSSLTNLIYLLKLKIKDTIHDIFTNSSQLFTKISEKEFLLITLNSYTYF